MDRGYLQISFKWIFAIIVGAFILFLAIYMSIKISKVEQYQLGTETAKEIEVLLNPLETSFESAVSTSITLPQETRLYLACDETGFFGKQLLQVSQKSFGKWPAPSAEITSYNKYIFSKDIEQGKKFYVFSKPFKFPFKVADLIYLTSASENYCFVYAPEEIEEEISDLKQNNPDLNLHVENCENSENFIQVCFKGNCDIEVDYDSTKSVEKKGETVYFETDALMYAAIFSDKEIYECQVKRLMKRLDSLIELYYEKEDILKEKGCTQDLRYDLMSLENEANSLQSSEDLFYMMNIVENIENKNSGAECPLW